MQLRNTIFFCIFVGDSTEKLLQLRGIFYQSPLANLVKASFEDKENKNEATENYLNDFLHMMYKPIVEGELQVNNGL